MTVGICTEFVDYCEYNTFTEHNIYETEYKNLRLYLQFILESFLLLLIRTIFKVFK